MRVLAALAVLLAVSGCTREWRTEEPVTAATWRGEISRPAASVGRLARLAVLPPVLEVDASEEERSSPEWQGHRDEAARTLQQALADYLRDAKGYDTALAADRAAAGSVDGFVIAHRWIRKPWSTGKAIGNLFLMNIPLFQAMSDVNLQVAIEEAATGQVVWRGEMKGEVTKVDVQPDLQVLLGDLDNAVPAILRR